MDAPVGRRRGKCAAPPGTACTAPAFGTNALTQHAAHCLKRPARGDIGGVRIVRTFVWSDERPDDTDEIRSLELEHHVRYHGVLFHLRTWDIRYPPGERRVTEAIYDEAVQENVHARSA